MKFKRYFQENYKFYTKALRLFKNDGKVKLIVSYSKSKDGRKWHDNKKHPRTIGYFKSKEIMFTARAIVIGSHRFSLLIAE